MENAINVVTTRASALSTRHPALIPLPEIPINVRLATNDDIPFIDELQKKNNKSLGFMFKGALEGKIKRDEILIAEEVVGGQCLVVSAEEKDTGGVPTVAPNPSDLTTNHYPLTTRVGYLIGNDRYQKRDELGCIFQLCVVPDKRRGLRGATLLKALFERASYGCKLYCCWCAQDLEANHFWEAMGFVPVAFRSGAKKKLKGADGKRTDRVHIFWQKRIRAGDNETPWWYPHETGGGAINEDRIVLPIPPGVHWSEVRSVVVPGEERSEFGVRDSEFGRKMIEHDPNAESRAPNADLSTQDSALSTAKSNPKREKQPKVEAPQKSKRLRLTGMPSFYVPPPARTKCEKNTDARKKTPKVRQKNDPAKVKAARELRDRYMEHINRHQGALESHGKYDVSRLIEGKTGGTPVPLLPVKQITGQTPVPSTPVPPHQKLLAA